MESTSVDAAAESAERCCQAAAAVDLATVVSTPSVVVDLSSSSAAAAVNTAAAAVADGADKSSADALLNCCRWQLDSDAAELACSLAFQPSPQQPMTFICVSQLNQYLEQLLHTPTLLVARYL